MKTSQKAGNPIPLLEEAVQLMKDVPKQANDAMALSMIVGYDGNIHANGAIILQVSRSVCAHSLVWVAKYSNYVVLYCSLFI